MSQPLPSFPKFCKHLPILSDIWLLVALLAGDFFGLRSSGRSFELTDLVVLVCDAYSFYLMAYMLVTRQDIHERKQVFWVFCLPPLTIALAFLDVTLSSRMVTNGAALTMLVLFIFSQEGSLETNYARAFLLFIPQFLIPAVLGAAAGRDRSSGDLAALVFQFSLFAACLGHCWRPLNVLFYDWNGESVLKLFADYLPRGAVALGVIFLMIAFGSAWLFAVYLLFSILWQCLEGPRERWLVKAYAKASA